MEPRWTSSQLPQSGRGNWRLICCHFRRSGAAKFSGVGFGGGRDSFGKLFFWRARLRASVLRTCAEMFPARRPLRSSAGNWRATDSRRIFTARTAQRPQSSQDSRPMRWRHSGIGDAGVARGGSEYGGDSLGARLRAIECEHVADVCGNVSGASP